MRSNRTAAGLPTYPTKGKQPINQAQTEPQLVHVSACACVCVPVGACGVFLFEGDIVYGPTFTFGGCLLGTDTHCVLSGFPLIYVFHLLGRPMSMSTSRYSKGLVLFSANSLISRLLYLNGYIFVIIMGDLGDPCVIRNV